MKDLEAILLKLVKESDVFAVFPSEVALQFWQRQLIKNKALKAIALNRFISWDRFKSMCLGYPENLKRVNQVARFLFLTHLLNENKMQAVFKSIIPEAYRDSSVLFYKSFLPYLPMLDRLDEIDVHSTLEGWSHKKSDLNYMFKEYKRFLERNGLFEPNFIKSQLHTGEQNFKIIFPELIDDFDRFQSLLRASDRISFYSCEKMSFSQQAGFVTYTTVEDEFDSVLLQIGDLLDQGIAPWDIIISACGDADSLVELEARAKRFDVPLFLHQGTVVNQFQSVKLFFQLQNVHASGFNYESLEELFLNQALPWKNSSLNKRLLDFGAEAKCFVQEDGMADMWDKAFEKAKANKRKVKSLIDLFSTLQKSIKAIVFAKNFSDLKDKLMLWVQSFLDTSAWNDQALRTFQFSVKVLDELHEASEVLDLPLCGNPLNLWQKYLEDKIYVERPDKLSVPVYSYRVSAGIVPAYHFIIQTSQKRLQIVEKKYPYLTSHEEMHLSDFQKDMTVDFMKIYSYSGQKVFFSFSETDYNGTNLIPAKLMNKSEAEKRLSDEVIKLNHFYQELLAWKGDGLITKIHSLQAESIQRYKQTLVFHHKTKGFTGFLNPDLVDQLIAGARDKEGWLRISHSHLEAFLNCPIQFFWRYFFNLTEEETDVEFFSPMEQGNLVHYVFSDFYENLKSQGIEKISDLGIVKAEALMNVVLNKTLESFGKKYALPPRIIWNYYRRKLKAQAQSFVENELTVLADSVILETELWVEEELSTDKIKIVGKIDRLSEVSDGLVLLDYKRTVGAKKDLFDERVNSYQLPFYMRLLLNSYDKKISKAGYYDFTKGKYSFVLDSEENGRELTDQTVNGLLVQLEEKLNTMILAIKSGNLLVRENTHPNCDYCDFRALCRKKFVLHN